MDAILDASTPAGVAPIDRNQLAAQTGADLALEREVLGLFLTKSAADLERLRAAATQDARREAAHTIVGSARAVGAGDVARLAAAVETGSGDWSRAVEALAIAIQAAQTYIRTLLDE